MERVGNAASSGNDHPALILDSTFFNQELDFTLAESQWAEEWAALLALASQPGEALEQLHVFCLAHVLRRPICVYGVKYVKSWRGENLGLAKFEGVYLPLLWDRSFCYRWNYV